MVYFIIPGLGNSGAEHWQTWLESAGDNVIRIHQKEWELPSRYDWVATIEEATSNTPNEEIVLIGHSLGCTAIAYWATEYGRKIRGALLVAPSDVEAPQYTFDTKGFEKVPLERISFPTIVVASENDEWVSLDRARFFAEHWRSQFINLGNAGHINVASGYGPWPQGLEILKNFSQI